MADLTTSEQTAVVDSTVPETEKVATEPGTEPEATTEEKPEHRENRVQKRIVMLTREKYEFKARAELAEKMLQSGSPVQQQAQGQKPVPDGKPVRVNFDNDELYIEALADWKYQQRMPEIIEGVRRQVDQTQPNNWKVAVAEAEKAIPDYREVIEEADDITIPPPMEEAIATSDVGPQILYQLAKDPVRAQQIMAMPPAQAIREIGKIDAAIARKGNGKAGTTSRAPEPIEPVGNRGRGAPDLEKIPMSEFVKIEQARLAKLGRRK